MMPRGRNKRQRKRIKWLSSMTRWRRVGEEQEYGDIYLKRAARKPVDYMCEMSDANGVLIQFILRKRPKGTKGWDVLLSEGAVHTFSTKRKALAWASRLQVMEEGS